MRRDACACSSVPHCCVWPCRLLCCYSPLVSIRTWRRRCFQHCAAAEKWLEQHQHTSECEWLADILQGEELRPFDEYSFLKVTANPLFKNSAIITSPLSELPPQSA